MRRLSCVALLLAGCLEAPTLDDCYSAADCPGAMACQAGACGPPLMPSRDGSMDFAVPDFRLPDGRLADSRVADGEALDVVMRDAIVDAMVDAMVDATADAIADATADYAVEPEPRCRVVDVAVLHTAPSVAHEMRVDVARIDEMSVAIIWQGPEADIVRVACHRPGVREPLVAAEHRVNRIGDARPAIAVEAERVVAAWVDHGEPSWVKTQGHTRDRCAPMGEPAMVEATTFGQIGLASDAEGTTLAAQYNLGELFYGLYIGSVPWQGPLPPLAAAPRLIARSFAIAADGDGIALAWTAYHDESAGDALWAARLHALNAEREPLLAVDGIKVDALAPTRGGFALAWRSVTEPGVLRNLWVVEVDDDPRVTRGVGVYHEPPGAVAGDLTVDAGGWAALTATSEGSTVTLWTVDPHAAVEDAVEGLAIAAGEHPAVVTIKPGVYGVAFGHRTNGEGHLKWAQVACDLPLPPD